MRASPRERSVSTRRASVSIGRSEDETNHYHKDDGYEEGRITVSVRVRPLNAREAKLTVGTCVAALAAYHTLYIFPPGETQQNYDALVAQNPQLRGVSHHRFTFDHVYPTDATQEQVYAQIGHPVLQSSFRGYHTCIFAYGQTGSGKSYCMMGSDGGRTIDENPGIIPRLCKEMFAEMITRQAAAAEHHEQVEFSVCVSYLEIYRERVRSLLDDVADGKIGAAKEPATPRTTVNALRRAAAALQASESGDGNLRVREHPTLGVYVEGLAEIPVTSVDQVMRLMVRGNNRRHTATTKMNDTSSRSHAIFTIQLLQQRLHTVPPSQVDSETSVPTTCENTDAASTSATTLVTATTQLGAKINLVDLAGSERAKATGADGDALKEGAQINRSLTTLGIVINALAVESTSSASGSGSPHSRSAAGKRHIPYRDSTLTFLLKESLGGNSKTFMIATVSPSADSYDESVSTLRYADRAKAIMMRAFVNETAGDKRIRELEEEVTRLRDRIAALLDAEATRASATTALTAAADTSPSLKLSPSPCGVPDPVVLADSTSLPVTAAASEMNSSGLAMHEGDEEDSGATDLGTATRLAAGDDDDEAEGHHHQEQPAEVHELFAASPSATPGGESEVAVDTLRGDLRRAEGMIRQMSVTQAELDAHIAKLVEAHRQERTAAREAAEAAEAARLEAERVAATAAPAAALSVAVAAPSSPVQTSTMRLHRDEPYLLNTAGAGDWVVAHLGPTQTCVGVARARKAQAARQSREMRDSAEEAEGSYDSSLALPSDEEGEESAEEEDEESDSAGVRYVKLPRTFSGGVGAPHCTLERTVSSPAGTTRTVILHGCDGYTTYVIRPQCQTPLIVRGSGQSLQLQSSDVLDVGQQHIQLKYMDPAAPPLTSRGRRTVPLHRGRAFPATSSAGGDEHTESEPTMNSSAVLPLSWGARREAPLRESNATTLAGLAAEDRHPSLDEGGEVEEGDTTRTDADDREESSSSSREERHRESAATIEDSEGESGGSQINSPTEQPGRSLALPSRPFIPTLALARAFSSSASPQVLPPGGMVQHHSDPATGGGEDHEDTAGFSSSATWASSKSHVNATRRTSSDRALTFSDSGIAGAASPSQSFKSRKPSRRAEAIAATANTAVPHAAMTSAELQSMRSAALSSTYRSELPAGFVARYNLILVGPSGGGKTSLISNLAAPDKPLLSSLFSAFTSSARGASSTPSVHPTIGIQAQTIIAPGAIPMSLYTQELGGTPCFSPLLDQLPSHRVTYLLCFALHCQTSLMTLRGVVEDILCRTDSHTVSLVLVGTHADRDNTGREEGSYLSRLPLPRQEALQRQLEEVEQQVVSLVQMLQPYPQLRPTVVGRFAIDNVHRHIYTTGFQAVEGFPQWLQWLADLARDRCKADADFANGLVPARCMELGRQVSLLRQHGKWCVSLRDFKTLAAAVSTQYKVDPVEPLRTASQLTTAARDSLRQHVQLLADWGVLLHRYRSLPLRQHVILDVLWLSRLLAALACCPLIAAAASDGLSKEEAATMVDVLGEEGAISLTRKEAALLTLLTPEAERVVDMVKVSTTDTPHLLRSGVLSIPVLIAILEPHFTRGADDVPAAVVVGRMMDNTTAMRNAMHREATGRRTRKPLSSISACLERGGSAGRVTRYAVPLAGVVELLSLLDLIIVGRKLSFSPAATNGAAVTSRAAVDEPAETSAAHDDGAEEEEDAIEKESFVLYPLSFLTPASAGVTWVFPCFLSGPFYVFKMDMVPRNFFPKLLCRLSTVADKMYLGPVEAKAWGSATQRCERSSLRPSGGAGGHATGSTAAAAKVATASVVGPFDSYFDQRGGQPFVLPFFSPYLASTTADGRLRRREGFWFDAAWLVYRGDDGNGNTRHSSGCRVLVRLVHHSVFLSFHCHGVAAAASSGDAGSASAGVQDFYEAVLEAVRYVVEEFPGGRCEESLQCCVDTATLLQAEEQHPALQRDQEAAQHNRHMRFARISENINNLERVLSKSGTALRTARTARRPNVLTPGELLQPRESSGEDGESAYVPLLRNFRATPPLSIYECIRRWKSEQRLHIAPDVEARLTSTLCALEECYHSGAASDSCAVLDVLLDVLARVNTT